MATRMTITGDRALIANFRAMSKAAQGKALRGPVDRAGKIIEDATRILAPQRSGATKRAVTRKTMTRKGRAVCIIGVRRDRVEIQTYASDKARRVNPGKYAYLVESGTKRTRANPFAREARALAMPEAAALLTTEIPAAILAAVTPAKKASP
jgi:HK97 gp10 family phage protein